MSVEEHRQHVIPTSIYVGIWAVLMVLTGVTVFASFIELGDWNIVLALTIASIKATLVVLFFMHVKYSSKLTQLTIFCGVFMFLTLIGMTLADYISRAWGQW